MKYKKYLLILLVIFIVSLSGCFSKEEINDYVEVVFYDGDMTTIIQKSKVLKGIISDELVEYDYENIDVLEFQSIIDIYEKELSSRIRLIPYKHAGSNKSSIILGFKADYIEIDKNKISNIIIGLSNFNDLEYDAILSPNIL